MIEYVIAMKSGFSFIVKIKDVELFYKELGQAIDPHATTNIFAAGGVIINVGDISAIYPLSAEHGVNQKRL